MCYGHMVCDKEAKGQGEMTFFVMTKELLTSLAIFFSICFSLEAEQQEPAARKRQIGTGSLIGSELLADPYRLKISAYSEDEQRGYLQLSNGTVWQYLKSHPYREAWLVGDTVFLERTAANGWVLSNGSYGGRLAVKMVKNSATALPVIAGKRNGGGVVILNDGSMWAVGFWQRLWNRLWRWQVGDRIIITPNELPMSEATHQLINVDQDMSSVGVKKEIR